MHSYDPKYGGSAMSTHLNVEGDTARTIRNDEAIIAEPTGWKRGPTRKRKPGVDHKRKPRTRANVRGGNVVKVSNMYNDNVSYFKIERGKRSGARDPQASLRETRQQQDARLMARIGAVGTQFD